MIKRLCDLVLIVLTISRSFGQTLDNKGICDKITEIDTSEYKSNFVKSDLLRPTIRFHKVNDKLIIQTADSVYTFIDYRDIRIYKVVAEDKDRNWIWIEEGDLYGDRHFLVNSKTSRVDTLIGPPKIFGDKIVCLEEGDTDSPRFVEIYKIKNDKIILLTKFRLNPCDKLCCVRTIYLKGKTIFLADNWNKKYRAWKIKVF